ncbi:MAG: hypothetical protein O8C63_11715 [Candidatus Methanoperedens sp.]|nr:hypothetical protein [Candidatus Methanoperedens sp.]
MPFHLAIEREIQNLPNEAFNGDSSYYREALQTLIHTSTTTYEVEQYKTDTFLEDLKDSIKKWIKPTYHERLLKLVDEIKIRVPGKPHKLQVKEIVESRIKLGSFGFK